MILLGVILLGAFFIYIFYLGATDGCNAAHVPLQQGMSCGWHASHGSAGLLQSDFFARFVMMPVLILGLILLFWGLARILRRKR